MVESKNHIPRPYESIYDMTEPREVGRDANGRLPRTERPLALTHLRRYILKEVARQALTDTERVPDLASITGRTQIGRRRI